MKRAWPDIFCSYSRLCAINVRAWTLLISMGRRMEIRGFTFAGSSRGAFQPIFESALFCSGGL